MWYQNVLQLSEFFLFLIIPFSLDWQIKVIITNCISFHYMITHEEQTKIPFYKQHILPHHRSSAYKSQTLLPYEIQPSLPTIKIMNFHLSVLQKPCFRKETTHIWITFFSNSAGWNTKSMNNLINQPRTRSWSTVLWYSPQSWIFLCCTNHS